MKKNFYPAYSAGKLHGQSYAILDQIDRNKYKPLIEMPVVEARESFLEMAWMGKPDDDVIVSKTEAESNGCKIPLWIYTPKEEGPHPVVLYFHGGGFVLGKLEEFNSFCTYISKGTGAIVISVGYRLAPEYKHPAQVEDAEAAFNWVLDNGGNINADTNRIAFAGDSAGGNLSAVLAIIARERKVKLSAQVLICPWLNLNSLERESYRLFGEGLWLSTEGIKWYRNHYLQNLSQAGSYKVSPGLLLDVSGLPPALIIAAEYDVLRDEAEEYYRKLKSAGVSVKYSLYEGMLHDFVTLPGLFDNARSGIEEICSWLNIVFERDS